MSPSSPMSMSLSCPGLCRFATCLFQICSQLSKLPWELLCSQALPLSQAKSLTSLGFPLSALRIYRFTRQHHVWCSQLRQPMVSTVGLKSRETTKWHER